MRKRELEEKRLSDLPDLPADPRSDRTGVLLSEDIEFYVEEGKLIQPFDENNLKPAGYELTVGDEAMKGGEYIPLSGPFSEVRIPPFEVVVIKTAETINLPRFLIARWNIRVKWAYQGLLWVGGPQVDPGYVGHLFCPIYNLSDESVKLNKGDPIALMDFVKTTAIEPEEGQDSRKLVEYPRPPKRLFIEDFKIDNFRSGLFARDVNVTESLKQLRAKVDVFSTLVLAILAILISVVALPYLYQEKPKAPEGIFDVLPFVISILAMLFAFFSWWSATSRKLIRFLQFGVVAALGAALVWFFKGGGG